MKPELQIAITNVTELVRASVWHQEHVRIRVEDVKALLEAVKVYASFDPRLPRDGADLLVELCGEKGRVP
jgi:hypothetical protein